MATPTPDADSADEPDLAPVDLTPPPHELGRWIEHTRKAKGLSRTQVAERSGKLIRQEVRRIIYESGSPIGVENTLALARGLGEHPMRAWIKNGEAFGIPPLDPDGRPEISVQMENPILGALTEGDIYLLVTQAINMAELRIQAAGGSTSGDTRP